jgi:flagellar export protein FliJ
MKAFEFSLQKSLEAREAQEKAAEIAFGKALRQLHAAEKEWTRLQNAIRRLAAAATHREGARVTPAALAQWALCMEDMRAQLDAQSGRVSEEQRGVKALREQLTAKMRSRKVMEQLKARELRRWMIETRRLERRDMDEIAGIAFVRRQREAARAQR